MTTANQVVRAGAKVNSAIEKFTKVLSSFNETVAGSGDQPKLKLAKNSKKDSVGVKSKSNAKETPTGKKRGRKPKKS